MFCGLAGSDYDFLNRADEGLILFIEDTGESMTKVDRMLHAAKQDGYPWESYVDIKDELNVWQKNGLSFSGGGMFLIDRNGKILSNSTDVDEIEPLIRKELGLPQLPPSGWQADGSRYRS